MGPNLPDADNVLLPGNKCARLMAATRIKQVQDSFDALVRGACFHAVEGVSAWKTAGSVASASQPRSCMVQSEDGAINVPQKSGHVEWKSSPQWHRQKRRGQSGCLSRISRGTRRLNQLCCLSFTNHQSTGQVSKAFVRHGMKLVMAFRRVILVGVSFLPTGLGCCCCLFVFGFLLS